MSGSTAEIRYLTNELRILLGEVIDARVTLAKAVTQVREKRLAGEVPDEMLERFKRCYLERCALILGTLK